ncbi:O-antigen ligase family protein [Nitratireductor pacificus]|uniref:O-antigen polymerase n=1 Tax=Nitratireductor pacificus pht-3B TaxID=391937 RepID=K2MHM5_9HYPH|nr:O-antigen ligase family protein [Nitratireductor pacificus]EKF20245.1 O-antigen polymerase [Nitratireductor pacificus pht-3B]
MSTLLAPTNAPALPRAAIDAKLVSLVKTSAIGMGVFLSGFVIREPAPYELYMVGLIAVWALAGLRISRRIAPLLTLLILFNVGGAISMSQLADLGTIPLYIAVSLFLALTSVFFAAAVEAEPRLLRVVFIAWVMAAVATAFFGILGYFNAFPGATLFTRFGRAAGVFEDPNVFGPFLTLPAIGLLYLILVARPLVACLAVPLFLVVAGGIFFSFSRGAWGLLAVTAILLVLAVFLNSRTGLSRLRVSVTALLALAGLVLALILALQIPAVADLFFERARLAQDYDSARLGRFARFGIGFLWAIEHPLGIGPLRFGQLLGEDTHNIWLKALLDYSWLGFAAYLTLILWTLTAGFRILFRQRPWQPYLLCVYIVFVGHVALGTVIDTDHWRHFYLLLGLLWGMIALEQKHMRAALLRDAPGD